ncbi:hypothetical protein [Nigerium massiliense]|uniref:hypothetical protein n=1 Tax=Nigerium massiliense TaxID=1522317 RepID=UPI000694AF19|nr:hypothetical protein [Nigerium massiliense]
MSDGIETARLILADGVRGWPRGCAFVLRMELEGWVREQSQRLDKRLPDATMRSQLLCLSQTVSLETAGRATYAWHRLSEACHQHAYDLAPTGTELNALLAEVESLIAADET